MKLRVKQKLTLKITVTLLTIRFKKYYKENL